MFHFSPAYLQPFPAFEYSSVPCSPYSGQLLAPRERYMQALAAQEAEEKLRVAEQLRKEELQLQHRLREIQQQQEYTYRPNYYHHQPLAFADQLSQLRDFEHPSRLESLRREIEIEEQRYREEAQARELLKRKRELELRRKEERERELLRRKEALRAQRTSAPQIYYVHTKQPLPKPVTVKKQTPVKPRVENKPARKETHEHPVFDGSHLFEAFFGPALRRPQQENAEAPKATPVKPSDPRLVQVEAIQASFEKLRSTFTFPTDISFNDSPKDGNPLSKLAYAAPNKPIREYEQALMKLVARLDEISSSGDETLRLKRKQAVLDIEKAIEDLEGQIEARWVEIRATQKSVPAEEQPQPVEDPESSVEISEASQPAQKEEPQTPASEAQTVPPSIDHTPSEAQPVPFNAEPVSAQTVESSETSPIFEPLESSKPTEEGPETAAIKDQDPVSNVQETSADVDVVMQEAGNNTADITPSDHQSTPTASSEVVNQPGGAEEASTCLGQPAAEVVPSPGNDQTPDQATIPSLDDQSTVIVDEMDLDLESASDSQLDESSEDSDFGQAATSTQDFQEEVVDSDWSEIEA